MGKQEQDIISKLAAMGSKDNELLSGTVVAGSVSESAMTCTVRIMMLDEDVPGVLLNVTENNVKGFIPLPADDSNVWMGWIDGELCVLKCAVAKKVLVDVGQVLITCNDVQFNGGANDGLVKIKDLVSRLNKVESALSDLISKYNTHIHTTTATIGAGSALGVIAPTTSTSAKVVTQTAQSDIENTKVKH